MREQRLLVYISSSSMIILIFIRALDINTLGNDVSVSLITAFAVLLMQTIISYFYKKRELLESMITYLDRGYTKILKLGYFDRTSINPLMNQEFYMRYYDDLCNDTNLMMLENNGAKLGFFNFWKRKEIYNGIIIPNRNLQREMLKTNGYSFKLYFKTKESNINVKDGLTGSYDGKNISSNELEKLQDKLFKKAENVCMNRKVLNCRYVKSLSPKESGTCDVICNIEAKKIECQLNYLAKITYGRKYKYIK